MLKNHSRPRSKPSCIVENKQESCDLSPVLSQQPSSGARGVCVTSSGPSDARERQSRTRGALLARSVVATRDSVAHVQLDAAEHTAAPDEPGRGDAHRCVARVPDGGRPSPLRDRDASRGGPADLVRRRGVIIDVPEGAVAGSRAIVSLPDDGSARHATVTIAFPPGLSTGQELTVALEV